MENILTSEKIVGAVLVDLSKAFDSIPHDLLIAKIHAYSFSIDAITFFYLYLKRRKQNVRVNNQLNAIGRIQKYMGFEGKEILLSSFVLTNFNYCTLVWHFCSSKLLKKIEKLQEWSLRILYNDSTSAYQQLLNKSSKASM